MIYHRREVSHQLKWDITRLYFYEHSYEYALEEFIITVDKFNEKFNGKTKTAEDVNELLIEYQEILKTSSYLTAYANLNASVDQTDEINIKRLGNLRAKMNNILPKLAFVNKDLYSLDVKVLETARNNNPDLLVFLNSIIKFKPYRLSDEIEQLLVELSPILNAPYENYNRFKLADMRFNSFYVNKKEYGLSFSKFENEYSSEINHEIRYEAFNEFYKTLRLYENGFASNYHTQLLKEKQIAKLRGFNSTEEYLLHNQNVTLDLYNRQIDVIKDKLRKPMHKYANLIKEAYNLDKMTFKDLKLPLDHEFEPEVAISEAALLNINAFKILGLDYANLIKEAFEEKWIDYPQNLGKSTGGFCSSPYQKGSYILLNWSGKMEEAFVMAHELGHAVHAHFSSLNQSMYNSRSSMYFIEAPSTFNELVFARFIMNNKPDPRFRRWVLASLISRTYYHNFVTHLLEAVFQREVYKLIDNNEPISARGLTRLKRNILRDFWGDAVEISDDDGLTWMRQPHYFMGLYPYTYSAGLTISTNVIRNIDKKITHYDDWVNVLTKGGTLDPVELAKLVNIDLTTEEPLNETIDYISDIIDEIEAITNQMKGNK